MFHIMAGMIWGFIAWSKADWSKWYSYYPTILYMIACDLLYNFITEGFSLWSYTPTGLFPNHTYTNIYVMFVIYPLSILVFLSRFPKDGFLRKVGYIALWTCIYFLVESLLLAIGLMEYHHGWSLWSSFVFDLIIFFMLYLHYRKPMLALFLSIPITVALVWWFKIPITE